ISAKRAGVSEEAFIGRMNEEHQRDFAGFQIQFDNYGSTNSPENRELCGQFWTSLRVAGLIAEKDVSQLFDPVAGTFLADRFVKGTCPKCKSPNQWGDNCDKCGSTYTPAGLIDPVSTLSGAKPELRSAKHLFVELEKLHGFLQEWTQSGKHLQDEVANYLKGHFLGEPLRDWDISRPAPYFGFEIPDSPGNYWYVWFDAPIGYIASRTAKFVQPTGLSQTYPDDGGLFARAAAAGQEIAAAYEACDYNRAMRLIMELADRANPYIDAKKPWVLAKQPGCAAELQDTCTVGLNLFRQIVVYLSPVLPKLAGQAGSLLNDPIKHWEQSQQPLV